MSYQNDLETISFAAEQDLSDTTAGTGHLFKAVTVAGKIAANGQAAVGLLQFCANSGGGVSVAIGGVCKYVAGATVNSGDALTVTTSGYLQAATSGSYIVGRNLAAQVTSGSVGTGMFSFCKPTAFDSSSGHMSTYQFIAFSAKANLSAAGAVGKAVSFNAGDFAATSNVANGVLISGTTSGGTCYAISVASKVPVCAGNVVTVGRSIKVSSGWFLDADSGDLPVGRAIVASAAGNSGSTFNASVNFATPHYATSCLDIMYA